MKFRGEVERGPERNRLDFSGDPHTFTDPESRRMETGARDTS